jgi:hypothetical protein
MWRKTNLTSKLYTGWWKTAAKYPDKSQRMNWHANLLWSSFIQIGTGTYLKAKTLERNGYRKKNKGRAHRGARSSTDWARRAIVFIWTITFWLLIYRNKPLFLHLAYRFEPFQHPTISNQVFFLQIQKLRHDKPSLQLWRAGIHAWTFMLPCWLHWVDT